MKAQVAVYGTLKRGQSNHHYLASAEYLGGAQLQGFALYDLGPWPAVKQEPGVIQVEVYAVDAPTFAALDELEDYCAIAPAQGLYDRIEVDTPCGRAWLYLYNHEVRPAQRLPDGIWTRR
ncbi:gamma-glutamylcyclotransferase [Marinobacterium maritimum]|uniref:Gamma-glutamylcyclotransferase n=1 Tax=Marinobacterium maritimum TaxID=500162 RepID=A0ABP3TFA0_9GAMM